MTDQEDSLNHVGPTNTNEKILLCSYKIRIVTRKGDNLFRLDGKNVVDRSGSFVLKAAFPSLLASGWSCGQRANTLANHCRLLISSLIDAMGDVIQYCFRATSLLVNGILKGRKKS